ncbi:hypothetical protein AUJ77_00315 [Candidatus Nomurabacteria bacterium CG1_02_43_90]|uniref:Methyltransferase FkbM domain-containing protein n=1 Tax=Candidatus Nomurabacteria bacterium CG1_02_43_90 TaxID=1805281 RepID=A0A1J4V5F5_9BACT|nr:MAG: hypothetical protein AUJ77_00315 [Candidatus Nomurabacteria bacterium CG1_02_43_90]
MINRSKIKYSLKKLLPKSIFDLILALWQTIFRKLVDILDALRLKRFNNYRTIETAHHGHKFSLFISPKNGFIDKHIFLYGTYEPQILDLLVTYLKKGSTFVDIGANIGQHSMLAGSIVGDTGKVYSFEPIPYIYEQFLDSLKINHFERIVHAHNVALGKENKEESLYVEKNNVGGSSIVSSKGKEGEKISITIKRGDELLESLSRIDMVKIDVEGYEYEVLVGIKKTLKKHKPIIVLEFSGKLYSEKGGTDGGAILSLLRELDYAMYDVEDYMKKITSTEEFLTPFTKEKSQCDILCLPKQHAYEI